MLLHIFDCGVWVKAFNSTERSIKLKYAIKLKYENLTYTITGTYGEMIKDFTVISMH